ncbi:hypothetical protein GCM10007937_27520 [Mesorhizobium albiziae]|nr:hypothetical protein GCM10007937_27520 [Mesorhizobium albiziae]
MRGACSGGTIRIGVPDEYGEGVLVAILSRFSAAQPGTQVVVHCGSSTEFPEAIAAGRLDVALYSPANVKDGDLIVCQETAIWASSKFHDLANRRPLPVALFDKSCWWRDRSVSILKESGLDFHIACTSESVAGVRAAIASGIAVGVLPESSLTPDLRILSELPDLGSSRLVLGVSPSAPDRLAKAMTSAISAALQGVG